MLSASSATSSCVFLVVNPGQKGNTLAGAYEIQGTDRLTSKWKCTSMRTSRWKKEWTSAIEWRRCDKRDAVHR